MIETIWLETSTIWSFVKNIQQFHEITPSFIYPLFYGSSTLLMRPGSIKMNVAIPDTKDLHSDMDR